MRSSFVCPPCGSERTVHQWRFGGWIRYNFPLAPRTELVDESRTYEEVFGSSHSHRLRFAHESPYYFGFIWGGCALGAGARRNWLAFLCEHNDGVRGRVARKISDGEWTPDSVASALALPSRIDLEKRLPSHQWEHVEAHDLARRLLAEILVESGSPSP